jgi:signal transduction histidine kinase
MQERVQFAGGQIKINSISSQGTRIQAYLPMPSPEHNNKTPEETG